MKRFLVSAIFLCFVILSYSQEGKRSKHYPRFQKEESKTNRNNLDAAFKKNLEMQTDDELRAYKSETDQLGMVHDKFQQFYKKIKVEGCDYAAHSHNNIVESYSGEFKGIKNFDVNPSISASQGLQSAIKHVGARIYAWDLSVKDGYPDYKYPKGELVIIGGAEDENLDLTLAWKYDIYAADPLYRAEVYIDAKTGEFVKENNLIHNTNVVTSGATLYNGLRTFTADYTGTAYRLRQTTSGGGVQTYTLKNGTNYASAADITTTSSTSWSDATAVQAHWGAERTWAFFNEKFSRNSFNNAGAIIKSYVHYSKNYVNAFWDGSRMTYGDGNITQGYGPLVSLDICGHEITHGVTTYSANLTYSYESGALNESFSDIFGECIENFAKGTNDWMMSCDIGINGACGAFRNMANPNQFSDPDTYKGTYWYTGTGDYGGVHYNSGVQNKWFYILTTGESGVNDKGYSYSVQGIGLDKASRIAYRNLTVYLTASSNYAVARAGAIQAATDLYGAGSPEVSATSEAWNAVGVYAPAPDTQPPTAPVLSSTSKTQTTIALSWTAATDNVGVTGYDVFVNGGQNNTANITTRTYTVSGLTSGTTYSIYVTAKDAAGNKTPSNTISVTTSGSVVETLVKEYYFETSLENWVPSNTSNCVWTNNSSYAFEGNGSVMIRSSNTNATTPTISLAGFSQVEVRFYFTAVGMESNKTFNLRYSSNNGSNWSTIATFTSASTSSGTRFVTDRGFYVATITMNSTSFNSTAKFRIQNNGSNTSDIIYFDAVTIKGRTNTTGSGNTVTLAAATKTFSPFEGISGDLNNSERIISENDEVVLYPNPVVNTLNINTRGVVKAIKIYSSNGSVIRTVYNYSDYNSVDLSGLEKGIYFVEIFTEKGSVMKKIIKQ
jgi:Zn-dependent metalloprotease